MRRQEDGYAFVTCVADSTSHGPLRPFLTFRDMRAIMSDCCIMPGTHLKLLQVLLEVEVSVAQVVRVEVAGLVMVGIKVDCFSGKFDKTGTGIDDKAAQYDSVHVASDGGLLEIKGVFAM